MQNTAIVCFTQKIQQERLSSLGLRFSLSFSRAKTKVSGGAILVPHSSCHFVWLLKVESISAYATSSRFPCRQKNNINYSKGLQFADLLRYIKATVDDGIFIETPTWRSSYILPMSQNTNQRALFFFLLFPHSVHFPFPLYTSYRFQGSLRS